MAKFQYICTPLLLLIGFYIEVSISKPNQGLESQLYYQAVLNGRPLVVVPNNNIHNKLLREGFEKSNENSYIAPLPTAKVGELSSTRQLKHLLKEVQMQRSHEELGPPKPNILMYNLGQDNINEHSAPYYRNWDVQATSNSKSESKTLTEIETALKIILRNPKFKKISIVIVQNKKKSDDLFEQINEWEEYFANLLIKNPKLPWRPRPLRPPRVYRPRNKPLIKPLPIRIRPNLARPRLQHLTQLNQLQTLLRQQEHPVLAPPEQPVAAPSVIKSLLTLRNNLRCTKQDQCKDLCLGKYDGSQGKRCLHKCEEIHPCVEALRQGARDPCGDDGDGCATAEETDCEGDGCGDSGGDGGSGDGGGRGDPDDTSTKAPRLIASLE